VGDNVVSQHTLTALLLNALVVGFGFAISAPPAGKAGQEPQFAIFCPYRA